MSRGRGYNVVTLFIGRVPKLISLPSDHPDAGSGWQDATLYGRQGCPPPRPEVKNCDWRAGHSWAMMGEGDLKA